MWWLLLGCVGGGSPGGDSDDAWDGTDPVGENLGSSAGDFALDYLRGDVYDRLHVEIDHVAGQAPSEAALDRLREVLEDLCDKPGGGEIEVDDEIPDQGGPAWGYDAVESLALEWREQWHGDGVAVVHALYLDGHYEGDTDASQVLGYAWRGSNLVMFQETISETGAGLPLLAEVEPTVLAHEMGHLLGLVNNGVEMVSPHQDTAHGNHDVDDGCLMYWAVETSDVVDVLLGTVPDFDAACLADLEAAKR